MRKLFLGKKHFFNLKLNMLWAALFLMTFCTSGASMAATYKTVDGQVLIEAEQYTRLGGTVGGKWTVSREKAGYSGSGYLQASEDDPKSTSFTSNISRVEYEIDFKTTGTYYVHLRTWAMDHTENGFFATIDGRQVDYEHDHAYFIYVKKLSRWWWYTDAGGAELDGLKVSFYVSSPGKKVFSILRREKGTRLDMIWLTKHQSAPQNTATVNLPDPSIYMVTGSVTPTPSVEICDDGKDNDGDGKIDCMDSDCDNNANCSLPSTETNCSNNADDDGDGWTDCADPDCDGASICTPSSEANCSDGIDNDGDGMTDCADIDCSGAAACSSALYSQSFDSSQGSFDYEDDLFRNTSQPYYAQGDYVANGGYSGGGLLVDLGGIDSVDIKDGMSGGWSSNFAVPTDALIRLSMRYRLITNNYDADECGQALVAIDGQIVSVDGNDYVHQLCGDGDSGWRQASVDISVSAGTHQLAIGAFNNKKTGEKEHTELFIDDVIITLEGESSGGDEPSAPSAGDYTYSDDTFRSTNNGMYASGSTESGALKVTLGGIDGRDITNGISGGWKSTITTSSSGTVQINLMYRLITNNYDDDESGQALVSINGKLYGLNGEDYLDQIYGIGDSGWQEATLSVDLAAGNHTLIVGGYNNKKTGAAEVTEVLFDYIEILP
jgi:hypothetical protein